MDTRIPMMLQLPDFGGSFMAGLQAGAAAKAAERQNALANLYETQGPGIMQGQPAALNALAQLDPQAALGIRQAQQGMALDAERMQIVREQAKAQAAEMARTADAARVAAEAARIETIMAGAAPLYTAARNGDPAAMQRLIGYLGQNGIQATPETVDTIMYASDGAREALKAVADLAPKPVDPMKGVPSGYLPVDPGNLEAGVKPLPGYKPQSMVTVNNGGGSDKQIFDSMMARYDVARAANAGLAAIATAKSQLDAGIISGAFADERLALQKAASALGIGDVAAITNTETFRSAIAPLVSATIKATVGSANISNSDREFAEKAVGGNITLDATSIARLLDVLQRANVAIVNDYSAMLDKTYPANGQYERERAILGLSQTNAAPVSGTGQAPGGPGQGAANMAVSDIASADIDTLLAFTDAEIDAMSQEQAAAYLERINAYNRGGQ